MALADSVSMISIPPGDAGTLATLKRMRVYAREGSRSLPIRELALHLISTVPGAKNWSGQVRALHKHVQKNIQYVRDIAGVETLQTPVMTLTYAAGDCDDQATLLAALLLAVGHPVRFVAVATRPGVGFCHVYAETKIGARWYALETTEDWPAGRGPAFTFKRMVLHA